MTIFTLEPIGFVRSTRRDAIDDDWDNETMSIQLHDRFSADALAGLDSFSHATIIFLFDQVPDDKIETGARRPRGRADWPLVGIFAQRGKNRPNRIGVTTCEILAVDKTMISLRGLDAIDGTPVLDIKPVMQDFLPRGTIRQPDWVGELMSGYWKN